MGFDASRAMRGLDTQRLPILSMSRELQQHHKILRSLGGIDRMQEFVQGSTARNFERLRSVGMSRGGVYANLIKASGPLLSYYKPPTLSHALSESMSRGVSGLNRDLAGLNYSHPLLQPNMQRHDRVFGNLGLSSAIARVVKSHGLGSATAAWSLQRVQSSRTSALQSILKSATTFGPIVVSPDYEDDAPFDYHPDLQGWLIPETATESGDAIDVEELIAGVYAYAVGIAQHHRTSALLTIVGKSGLRFLVRVPDHVVGGLILYWILHH